LYGNAPSQHPLRALSVRKRSMKHTKLVAAAALAVFAGAALPASAQYNGNNNRQNNAVDQRNEGIYRDGYRSGYEDGRANRRFDDRAGYGDRDRRGADPRRDNRAQAWQQRYTRVYTVNDDPTYQTCKQSADPAGVIAGALIGGLLGNTVASGNARTGATVAGVIFGGALGAGLTRNLDCEDRSYAYKAYSDGFNSGRPNQAYEWRNPRSGRRGVIRTGAYYNDPDGFRCSTFSQTIYVGGRTEEGRGRACQQPDGTWAIVG
jgi:surface antigen